MSSHLLCLFVEAVRDDLFGAIGVVVVVASDVVAVEAVVVGVVVDGVVVVVAGGVATEVADAIAAGAVAA